MPQGAWEYAPPSPPTAPPQPEIIPGGNKPQDPVGTKTLELPAFAPVDGWGEPGVQERLEPTASQTSMPIEKRFEGDSLSWDEPGRHRKVTDALGTGTGFAPVMPGDPGKPVGEPTQIGAQGEPANLGSQLEQAASMLDRSRNKEIPGDWSYRIEDEQDDKTQVNQPAQNALQQLEQKTGERERQESHTELPNAHHPGGSFNSESSGGQPKITIVQSNRSVNDREPLNPDFNPDLTPKMPLRAIPPSEKLMTDTGPRPRLPENAQWGVAASDQETHIKMPTEGIGFNEKLARLEEDAKSEKYNETTRSGLPSLRSILPPSRKEPVSQESSGEATMNLPTTPPQEVAEAKPDQEKPTRDFTKSVNLNSPLPVLPPETKFIDPSHNTTSDVHKLAEETGFFGITGASPSTRFGPRPSTSQSLPAQQPATPRQSMTNQPAAQPMQPLAGGQSPFPAPPFPPQMSAPPPTTPSFPPPQPEPLAANLSPFGLPGEPPAPVKPANLSPFGTGAPTYDEDGNASFAGQPQLSQMPDSRAQNFVPPAEPASASVPSPVQMNTPSDTVITDDSDTSSQQKARVTIPAAPEKPLMRTGQSMPSADPSPPARTPGGGSETSPSRRPQEESRAPRDPNLANRYAHLLEGSAADLPQQKRASKGPAKLIIGACVAVALCIGTGAVVYNMLGHGKGGLDITKIGGAGGNAAEQADTARSQGRWTEAMEHYDEAIAADPSDPELYHSRGNCAYALQQYRQAADDYDNALRLDPDNAKVLLDRAAALVWLKEYNKAIADYSKIIKGDSNNKQAYFGRALAYSRMKQYKNSLPDLRKATQLDPSYADAFRDLSAIYFSLGDYTASVNAADQALRLQPNSAVTYFDKATALRKLGRKAEAERAYSASLRIMPGRPDCFNDRGFTVSELGNKAQALRDFMAALEIDPQFALAANNLKSVAAATVKKFGKSSDAHELATAALAAMALGQTAQATDLADKAVQLKPRDVYCLQVQGETQMAAKQYAQAVQSETAAIAASPGALDPYYFRARANLHDGKFQQAADDYSAYIDRAQKSFDPEVSDHIAMAHLERSVAYNALGQGEKAASDGQRYLALSGWKFQNSGTAALLEWLGYGLDSQRSAATKQLDSAAAHLPTEVWPAPVLSFLRRVGSESDVMTAAADNNPFLTDAHTWLGFNAQLEGSPNQAADHFNWVKDHGTPDSLSYILASSKFRK
jgi:tetratricopeptide (TPR) repeat protein